jgi:hypothetical protein
MFVCLLNKKNYCLFICRERESDVNDAIERESVCLFVSNMMVMMFVCLKFKNRNFTLGYLGILGVCSV